jgi:hypothetical protein
MTVVIVQDAIHANISHIPAGVLAALYTTGSPDIKATNSDFNAHPNAVRIVQDHGSDETADIIDMELGAATPNDVINWLGKARHSFNTNMRPGQRWPGVYLSLSRLTEMANDLVAAHDSNVPLWIAEWGLDQASALHNINAANGPFPTVAFQIKNLGTTDFSLFSADWLNRRSGMAQQNKPTEFKVTTPPPLTVKAGTPAVAFGFGPQGEKVWVTFSNDGHTWSEPRSIP